MSAESGASNFVGQGLMIGQPTVSKVLTRLTGEMASTSWTGERFDWCRHVSGVGASKPRTQRTAEKQQLARGVKQGVSGNDPGDHDSFGG
jgi:hypothetical protein